MNKVLIFGSSIVAAMGNEAGPTADRKLAAWTPDYGATASAANCRFERLSDVLCVAGSSDGSVSAGDCGASWADNWRSATYDETVNRVTAEGSAEITALGGTVTFSIADTATYKYYYLDSSNVWQDFPNDGLVFNHCIHGTAATAGATCGTANADGSSADAHIIQTDGTLTSGSTDTVLLGVASLCDGSGDKGDIFAWATYNRGTGTFEMQYEQEHDEFKLGTANGQDPVIHDLIYVFGSQATRSDNTEAAKAANMVVVTDTNDFTFACTVALSVSTPYSTAPYDESCYGTGVTDPETSQTGACNVGLTASCTLTEAAPIAANTNQVFTSTVAATLDASAAIIQAIHNSNAISSPTDDVSAQDFLNADLVYAGTADATSGKVVTPSIAALTKDNVQYQTGAGDHPFRVAAGYYEREYEYGCQEKSNSPGNVGLSQATVECYFGDEDQVGGATNTVVDKSGANAISITRAMKAISSTALGPLPDGFPNFYVFGVYTIDLTDSANNSNEATASDTFGNPSRRLGASSDKRVLRSTGKVYM